MSINIYFVKFYVKIPKKISEYFCFLKHFNLNKSNLGSVVYDTCISDYDLNTPYFRLVSPPLFWRLKSVSDGIIFFTMANVLSESKTAKTYHFNKNIWNMRLGTRYIWIIIPVYKASFLLCLSIPSESSMHTHISCTSVVFLKSKCVYFIPILNIYMLNVKFADNLQSSAHHRFSCHNKPWIPFQLWDRFYTLH